MRRQVPAAMVATRGRVGNHFTCGFGDRRTSRIDYVLKAKRFRTLKQDAVLNIK